MDCKNLNYVLPNYQASVNSSCYALKDNKKFQAIVDRSVLPFRELQSYNNRFLNHIQLSSKSNNYRLELRKSRLEIMNLHGKINRLGETLDMHQRFLVCISEKNVPRLNQLVAVALRNRRSIDYIVGKVVDAIDGHYRARPSEDDKDMAVLILEIGGPSLLDICHKANILPSVSLAYRMRKQSRQIESGIGMSVKECYAKNTDLTPENSTYAFSIKADETYVTARPRYDGKNDCVQGLCKEHGAKFTKLESLDDATSLLEAVEKGDVHIPKEVTLIAGASMNDLKPTVVIAAWPTCDKGNFDDSLELFETLGEEYKAATGKDPMNYGTDGDGTRRQVFNSLLNHHLDPDSPIGQIISKLQLVDQLCGVHNETVSYDPKHLAKRCWTAFVNESVAMQGITIKKSDLKSLFSLLPESNSLHIDTLLYPKDKQNVPSASSFL